MVLEWIIGIGTLLLGGAGLRGFALLRAENDELRERARNLEAQSAKAVAEREEIQARIEEALWLRVQKELARAEAQRNELEAQLAQLAERLAQQQAELDGNRQTIGTLRRQIAALRTLVGRYRRGIQVLIDQLREHDIEPEWEPDADGDDDGDDGETAGSGHSAGADAPTRGRGQ